MGQYLVRRLLLVIPTLVGVSILAFLFIRLMPGDVVASILGEYSAYAKDAHDLRHKLGLDEPAPVQYVKWVGQLASGDLGTSLRTGRSISGEMRVRLPVTFELGALAMAFGLMIALPVGVLAAVAQDSVVDYLARGVAVLLLSIPTFWLAVLVITWPSVWWQWTPPVAYTNLWENPLSNLTQMIIPAFILGTHLAGTIMRLTRAQMLEILRQDYVRTAWAKGLRGRTVIVRHALRNAFIPVITLIGLQVPVLIGGAVVLENIFAIPGMGRYLLEAISTRDYSVVQATVLLVALSIVLSNIVVDVVYGVIDPRIRLS
jgi:peptide/nickel transport system permease protein